MNTYQRYVESIAQADRNVLIIFGIVALSILAWYSITFLPHNWQNPTRAIAWIYALLALTLTVIYSL